MKTIELGFARLALANRPHEGSPSCGTVYGGEVSYMYLQRCSTKHKTGSYFFHSQGGYLRGSRILRVLLWTREVVAHHLPRKTPYAIHGDPPRESWLKLTQNSTMISPDLLFEPKSSVLRPTFFFSLICRWTGNVILKQGLIALVPRGIRQLKVYSV